MMKQAEQIAPDDDAVIPARFVARARIFVQPYVKGWTTNKPNIRNFTARAGSGSIPPRRGN